MTFTETFGPTDADQLTAIREVLARYGWTVGHGAALVETVAICCRDQAEDLNQLRAENARMLTAQKSAESEIENAKANRIAAEDQRHAALVALRDLWAMTHGAELIEKLRKVERIVCDFAKEEEVRF